ncbi:MAG: hypothetical protein ABIJ59_12430 [Pseudomonadota bacterium]
MSDITPKIIQPKNIQPKNIQVDPLSPIGPGAIKNKSSQNSDGSFEKILDSRINAEGHGDSTGQLSSLSEIEGPFRAQHLNPASSDQAQLSRKLNNSIDLFERYATFLGDPDKSLKQAYEILEQILSQTQTMTEELDQQPESKTDRISGLKNILAQLMTTARVEQIKFDRGDYL